MAQSLAARIYYATPILGPVTRAIEKDNDLIWYVLVILVTILAYAVKFWGLVALTMAALAMVPVMLILLIVMARP
ncbi:MAG: hypothetical protein B7Y02_16215 [Rhodobacterales bacterium 17-64-5]|nr:MAG: hypothetical protein B7Y02_16215 [Rhodobacterales bacterium 17-64-5]